MGGAMFDCTAHRDLADVDWMFVVIDERRRSGVYSRNRLHPAKYQLGSQDRICQRALRAATVRPHADGGFGHHGHRARDGRDLSGAGNRSSAVDQCAATGTPRTRVSRNPSH
jgi:hypothetical protein